MRERVLTDKILLACREATAAEMARRGELRFPAGRGLAGARWDHERLAEVAELLEVLAGHEPAVRALDGRLAISSPVPADRPLISRKS